MLSFLAVATPTGKGDDRRVDRATWDTALRDDISQTPRRANLISLVLCTNSCEQEAAILLRSSAMHESFEVMAAAIPREDLCNVKSPYQDSCLEYSEG